MYALYFSLQTSLHKVAAEHDTLFVHMKVCMQQLMGIAQAVATHARNPAYK